jgi:hypothetical protein
MEAKNMNPRSKKKRPSTARWPPIGLFAAILHEGQAAAFFDRTMPPSSAGAIKALLQDWYVKRWKFSRRGIDRWTATPSLSWIASCPTM